MMTELKGSLHYASPSAIADSIVTLVERAFDGTIEVREEGEELVDTIQAGV